jgi:glucuronokinase
MIDTTAHARVGLVGNPSDMYFGRTIAAAITNFAARVTLWESPSIELKPHPINDSIAFDGLEQLTEKVRVEGYYGGVRLLFATCKKFYEFCEARDIALPERNFSLAYDTTIPRQVGLGGSSAIITATVRALMAFYGVRPEVDVPLAELPNLVLSVETEELGITAGLQDRVVQAYGGAVFMDFDQATMLEQGHGVYTRLDPASLPPLFLAYTAGGSESGKVHNDVRYRYEAGDPAVVAAMREFAEYAVAARDALAAGDHAWFGAVMDQNFDLRRRIYGDKAIGRRDMEMIDVARGHGCAAKFSGSQGAVVGACFDDNVLERLCAEYEARGFRFAKLAVHDPDAD